MISAPEHGYPIMETRSEDCARRLLLLESRGLVLNCYALRSEGWKLQSDLGVDRISGY